MSRNHDQDAQKNTYVCIEVISIRHIMRLMSQKGISLDKGRWETQEKHQPPMAL